MSQTNPLFDGDNAQAERRDLIDRIAEWLPDDVRADYYREISHLRELPENDEMLRILRAMQFLVLLIVEAPSDMADQREQLATLLSASLQSMQETHRATVAYQKKLEQQITQLPAEIEKGISPEAIAGKINESLRQQFAQSGLPQTVKGLQLIADQVKTSTEGFQATVKDLTSTYSGVAAKAATALGEVGGKIRDTTDSARFAQEQLSKTLLGVRKWLIISASSVALVLGLGFGGLLGWHIHTPSIEAVQTLPAIEPTIPDSMPAPATVTKSKPNSKKRGLTQPDHQQPIVP